MGSQTYDNVNQLFKWRKIPPVTGVVLFDVVVLMFQTHCVMFRELRCNSFIEASTVNVKMCLSSSEINSKFLSATAKAIYQTYSDLKRPA